MKIEKKIAMIAQTWHKALFKFVKMKLYCSARGNDN